MWKYIIRPLLFLLEPETAHHFTLNIFRGICYIPGVKFLIEWFYSPKNKSFPPISLFGLQFKNPVGLAAGLDKDGKYIAELALLGFSHIEIGTVTPRPQSGNPRPRMFRLPLDQALINRMGFNNDGAEALANRLKKLNKPKDLIVGINIGKNKDTSNEDAWKDYLQCFEILYPYADYFTINISSPNTPGLRGLQDKEPLQFLLTKIQASNYVKSKRKPILVKIAPDLDDQQIIEIKSLVLELKIDGLIMGNTTLDRSSLVTPSAQLEKIGPGGLSGASLKHKASQKIAVINSLDGNIPVIGVGGILDAASAQEKLQGGASLIQVYTGFIYAGPGLVKRICDNLWGS